MTEKVPKLQIKNLCVTYVGRNGLYVTYQRS